MTASERLREKGIETEEGKDLSLLSSFKTGGKAELFVTPRSVRELEESLSIAKEEGLRVTAIGSLTNSLVSDKGIKGMVISTAKLKGLIIKGDLLVACAGEKLDAVINKSIEHHLTGLEELGGIPGTIGGATFGNAGANGKDISTYFFYSDYLTKDGRLRRMPAFCNAFSYRTSPFSEDDIIIATAFRLLPTRSTAQAREKKEYYKQKRAQGGQYDYPSAGSFFRNPPLLSAGQIIDEAGFRGFEHKGALVSTHHANFIVNGGTATSQSIYELSELIRNHIAKLYNIELKREVKLLGDFS